MVGDLVIVQDRAVDINDCDESERGPAAHISIVILYSLKVDTEWPVQKENADHSRRDKSLQRASLRDAFSLTRCILLSRAACYAPK